MSSVAEQVFARRIAVEFCRTSAVKHGLVNLDGSECQTSCDGPLMEILCVTAKIHYLLIAESNPSSFRLPDQLANFRHSDNMRTVSKNLGFSPYSTAVVTPVD